MDMYNRLFKWIKMGAIALLPPLNLLLEPLTLLDEGERVLMPLLPVKVQLLGALLRGLEERPPTGGAQAEAEDREAQEAQFGRGALVGGLVVEGQGGWEDGQLR